jgi:hypothetical protein
MNHPYLLLAKYALISVHETLVYEWVFPGTLYLP